MRDRLNHALVKRHELVGHLDELTEGAYSGHMQDTFSAARRAGLSDVDWRVVRMMHCKDPKYNAGADPHLAGEVQQRKLMDGQVLEHQLAAEAYSNWERALSVAGMQPPPIEVVHEPALPFVHAAPNYAPETDVWTRTLELRTLDEAMSGDVSKPLPRPAVHTEDYSAFSEGKYVKDDCPIA